MWKSQCLYCKKCSVIEHHVAYSARNFAKSSFSDVTKVQNAGLPMVRSQTDYIVFSIRAIVDLGFGHLFITSNTVVLISSIKPISSNISLSPVDKLLSFEEFSDELMNIEANKELQKVCGFTFQTRGISTVLYGIFGPWFRRP